MKWILVWVVIAQPVDGSPAMVTEPQSLAHKTEAECYANQREVHRWFKRLGWDVSSKCVRL